ncbi:MAG: hypothetical protein HY790_01465 [Deltaproteobacteria bacterium]|nr:hypothetical protein [Deltaproteobacteria bacterium]
MSYQNKIIRGKFCWAGVFCLCLGLLVAAAAWGRSSAVEVRRLGLSRVGENTMLTVVLSRAVEPRISTRTQGGKPQLVMEFPQAQAGRLPTRLAGDDLLVEQVRTESSPGGGVKIVVDLFPELPYKFWRQVRGAAGGQTQFILGLTPDPSAVQARQAAPARQTPTPEPPQTPEVMTEKEPEPPPPAPEDYGVKEERGAVATGSFAELRRLIPKAGPLLQGLESDGWSVSESRTYDRPGQRFSRDFVLTHRRYPELSIQIVNLPANTPNVPNINIIMLTTDNLRGETADKYRGMRQWSFGRIKQEYEDIGDFFDEALKPLRIKLRQETKNVVMRDPKVFQTFLQRACPQKPQLSQKFMEYVNERVNQRFEGVQYTLSETPLVILNMVDFLYVKVFFLEAG